MLANGATSAAAATIARTTPTAIARCRAVDGMNATTIGRSSVSGILPPCHQVMMALALVKLGTLVLLPFEWAAGPANPTWRPNSIGLRYRAAGAMQLHSGRVCAVPARFRRNRTRHRGK